MNSKTGEKLELIPHIKQSIIDIITTLIGSRAMRREYGSNLLNLIDAPLNDATFVQVYQAIFEALAKWEPRIEVKSIGIESQIKGKIVLFLDAKIKSLNETVRFEGLAI